MQWDQTPAGIIPQMITTAPVNNRFAQYPPSFSTFLKENKQTHSEEHCYIDI